MAPETETQKEIERARSPLSPPPVAVGEGLQRELCSLARTVRQIGQSRESQRQQVDEEEEEEEEEDREK